MMRFRSLPLGVSLVVIAAAGAARAQTGATLTPDQLSYMVNKDLAGQRWTINLNLSSAQPPAFLNATGNVFKSDGSAPVFVLCQLRADSTGSLADPSSTFRFTCQGADACPSTATECARTGWTPISADVEIPASFFLPPGGEGATAAVTAGAPPSFAAIALARLRGLWSRVARVFADPALLADIGPRNAWAQATARGATLTYDGYNYLVNKDLSGERWSISLNLVPVQNADGTFSNQTKSVTGNVFKPDGSPPSFIYCVPRADSTGTLDDLGSTFRFSCQGASACDGTATGCAASSWTLLGDDIALPAGFLLPPGGLPAQPQSDPEIVVIGRTSDPPSIISPDFTLDGGSTSSALAAGGATCPVDKQCSVRLGSCDAVVGVVVQPSGGVCGCRLDDVPSSCITCGEGALGSCGETCGFEVGNSNREARGICLPFASGDASCSCYAIGAGSKLDVQSCGGTVQAGCPGQRCCVDDPRDGCDAAGGVDCAGICVLGDNCSVPPPDCVDASGDYSGTSSTSGSCNSAVGAIPIDESGASDFSIVQTGCSIQAVSNGQTFASGTVSGNQLTLNGAGEPPPIEGCSGFTSSQQYDGQLVGDALDLSGKFTASASCDFGEISCSLDSDISASR